MLAVMFRVDAACYCAIYLVKKSSGVLARIDRATFLHDLAHKANVKAYQGDFAGTFEIIRSLSGYTPRPIKAVKQLDGCMTSSEHERQLRWQEHFASLYNGSVVDRVTGPTASSSRAVEMGSFRITPEMTASSLRKLGDNAVGPDEITGSLLKAGGDPLAIKLNALEQVIVEHEQIPSSHRGGKVGGWWMSTRKKAMQLNVVT